MIILKDFMVFIAPIGGYDVFFGSSQDSNYLVKIYKKFLEYQILQSPHG